MLSRIQKALVRKTVRYVLARRCPGTIPRSGDDGKAVDCYCAYVYVDGKPFSIVKDVDEFCVSGRAFDGNRFERELSVPLGSIKLSELRINHYYGLATIEYKGVIDFIVNALTGRKRAGVLLRRFADYVATAMLNKRRLVMLERHELLRFLVERTRKSGETNIRSLDLMTEIYSIRWVLHPEGSAQEDYLTLLLDSFVDTGELKRVDVGEYSLQGMALATLNDFEREQRKHQDSLSIQRRLVILTAFIALFTAVQAGVIKFEPIFDFFRQSVEFGSPNNAMQPTLVPRAADG